MTVKELFDFVTDPTISSDNIDEYLEKMQEIVLTRSIAVTTVLHPSSKSMRSRFSNRCTDTPHTLHGGGNDL